MVDRPDFADRVLDALGRAFPAHRLLGVWLFGNQARGEATARSDVDLAVLADARLDPLAVGALRHPRAFRLCRVRAEPPHVHRGHEGEVPWPMTC
jgi:predicted nucleotidyltransferase